MTKEFIEAVRSGNADRVRLLLDRGADCNSRDGEAATMLMLASHAGNLPMVLALIEAGAEVNASDERGWTPLMKAAYNPELNRGFADVVQALIDAGANVEMPISYGIRPLMLAAGYGETAVVEALLKAGGGGMGGNEGGLTAPSRVEQNKY